MEHAEEDAKEEGIELADVASLHTTDKGKVVHTTEEVVGGGVVNMGEGAARGGETRVGGVVSQQQQQQQNKQQQCTSGTTSFGSGNGVRHVDNAVGDGGMDDTDNTLHHGGSQQQQDHQCEDTPHVAVHTGTRGSLVDLQVRGDPGAARVDHVVDQSVDQAAAAGSVPTATAGSPALGTTSTITTSTSTTTYHAPPDAPATTFPPADAPESAPHTHTHPNTTHDVDALEDQLSPKSTPGSATWLGNSSVSLAKQISGDLGRLWSGSAPSTARGASMSGVGLESPQQSFRAVHQRSVSVESSLPSSGMVVW